jgi:hypothetical protein
MRMITLAAAMAGAVCTAATTMTLLAAVPPATQVRLGPATTAPTTNPVKQILAEELNQLEREIAGRMMRRADLPPARRGRLELEIDLRILQRGVIAAAADAKFESNEQAAAWLRAKQFRDAVRAFEEARPPENAALPPSQQEAIGQLHRLSFAPVGASDEFCRTAALALINAVNSTPVAPGALPKMRPTPIANTEAPSGERAPSVAELTDDVRRLAAISVPLRQQLLALAGLAAAEKDDKSLRTLLAQSVALAKGLQNNTAVGPEARIGIETQLAEGIVLFIDRRTRDAGKARVDGLSRYRQILTRIGKLALPREQMDQLAPAFTFAQSNPDVGPRLLATIEQFFDTCAEWDALPTNFVALPAALRRPAEDLRSQFVRTRGAFLQDASRLGSFGTTPATLEQHLEEARRLRSVAEDVHAMTPSLDTLNNLKVRPAGALEKRVATAAAAAAAAAPAANRNDGQKYLDAVHTLANLVRDLSARPLGELPPPVVQTWAGNRLDAFENRWRNVAGEHATSLTGGAIELDASKVARLQTAMKLGDALRAAAQLEAVLPKTPALARWVDWAVDPATLQVVLSPYKEATAGAVLGYASDTPDAVDKWQRLHGRYQPLIALILRDAVYADACQGLPIGLAADAARLATPFENAPFATERFASYALTLWAHFERTADHDPADRVSVALAKRLARDLKLDVKIDEPSTRPARKPKP